ncbi:MAG: tetratricopeptide repeat protein [Patescibacteria group bacterium]
MYQIIFTILGLSLAGLVIIFFRKFPQLANLDLENLPEEKLAQKKREMLGRRVKAEHGRLIQNFIKLMRPVGKVWGGLQLKFRIYVGKIERLLHHEQRVKSRTELAQMPTEAVDSKLANLVSEGGQNLEHGNLEKAEELFIAAIKMDAKFAPAYRGLGDTYLAKGALSEAEETYQFLMQLSPMDDGAMVKISELLEKKGDLEQAINYLQQAVVINDSLSSRFFHLAELLHKVSQPSVAKEAIVQAVDLEQRNPKYLDLLIETGILCGDKVLAERGLSELRLVNPQNQKLESFQSRINNIAAHLTK